MLAGVRLAWIDGIWYFSYFWTFTAILIVHKDACASMCVFCAAHSVDPTNTVGFHLTSSEFQCEKLLSETRKIIE